MFSGSMADRLGRRRTFVTGLERVLGRLAAVQRGAERRAARARSACCRRSAARCSTRSRCRSSPTPSPTRASARRRWASGAPCSAISMALGPIVGGTLVSAIGWRSIFLAQHPGRARRDRPDAPLHPRVAGAEAAPVRSRRSGPGDRAAGDADVRHHRGPEPRVVLAGDRGRVRGGRRRRCSACCVYEPRRAEPLIDLRFFRSIPFASSIVISVAAFAAFGGFLFLNTLYLQDVRGLSPLRGRARHPADGRHDGGGVAAVGPHRRPPRPAPAARDRRRLPGDRLRHADRDRPGDAVRVAGRGVRRLRDRLRVRQRADHERRRVRDAARAGGRRLGDRHDVPPVRPDARCRRRRGDRRRPM